MDDDLPDFDRFDHDDAWRLGSSLVARCQADNLPVTISVRLGEHRVVHAAMAGTSADNDAWVDRKANVVRRFGVSSQAVNRRYVGSDHAGFLSAFGLSPRDYAATGGAVPIRVHGSLVGVLAVSGLESDEDHDLAIDSLRHHQAGVWVRVGHG